MADDLNGWTGKGVDGLERRIGNVEDDVNALRDVPAQIVRLEERMDFRFDSVDLDHANPKVNWKAVGATFLAVASAIGVPLALAFIGAPG